VRIPGHRTATGEASPRPRSQESWIQTLAQIANAANTIWQSLGDAPATDLRTYSEQVAARLDDAEQAQADRTIAQQAADAALRRLGGHEATAQRHSDAIARLCQAASVEAANQLLEAEESSNRKREAQESVDRTRGQLAAASKRTVPELRELILDRDAARMDSDEMSLTEEQSQLEKEMM
jgi:DNA repair protein SbcC/Rad50